MTNSKSELPPGKPFSYRIESVKDIEFHIYNLADYNLGADLDKTKLLITYNWIVNSNIVEKKISILLSIFYIYKSDEKTSFPLVNYFNETEFSIENFEEAIQVVDVDKIDIPDEAMHTFLSISISTARGILIEKLSKSVFHQFILPAITLDFVQKMVKNGPANHPRIETK